MTTATTIDQPPSVTAIRRHSRPTRIEWVSLVAALAPFAVAIVRARVQHWMPVGDAAYFTARSRDVFSAHTPLVGAWSSGSSVVGVAVNNLGPLQLDVLAPFTTVSPYLGTGIGSAVINAASVVVVWFVASRLFSPGRVAWVMAGTTIFVSTLGLAWLLDARQQYAMVIPFFALLWLTAGMWAGLAATVPVGLTVASLVLQTHFTYAYQTVIVTAAGVVGFAFARRRHATPAQWGRVAGASGAVVIVCWIQPLLDQAVGTGNIVRVFGPARTGQAGAGLVDGVQVVAGGALAPPFWLPGSIGDFLQPHDGITLAAAVLTVAGWLVASAAVVGLGLRSQHRVAVAGGAASVVALLAAVLGSSWIPVSMFGLVPQNYYWVWSIGAFLTIALLAGTLAVPAAVSRLLRRLHAGRNAVILPVLAVITVLASWPRYPVESVRRDEMEAQRIGRPLRSQLAAVLRSGVVDDTVEVDLSRAFFGNNYPYVMLVELQRAGIDFRFPPGNRNLDRFGESRCAPGGEFQRILIIAGRDPALRPGSIVLAQVVGISDAELAEYAGLQARFGDLLRSGAVAVDAEAVTSNLGVSMDGVDEVIANAGAPAAGLARSLDHWRTWGYVQIPTSERAAFDRWFDLERRSSADYQTVVLEPPGTSDPETC